MSGYSKEQERQNKVLGDLLSGREPEKRIFVGYEGQKETKGKESDLTKLAKATGGRIITNLDDLFEKDLGNADLVEERKIEEDRWVFIEGCKHPKSVTLLLRAGSQRVVDEAERSVHDLSLIHI